MNAYRKALVQKVFKMLDKDNSGVLDFEDIKGIYNASRHPDVLARKRTEEDVLTEFLDTFEQHYSFIVSTSPDAGRKRASRTER